MNETITALPTHSCFALAISAFRWIWTQAVHEPSARADFLASRGEGDSQARKHGDLNSTTTPTFTSAAEIHTS